MLAPWRKPLAIHDPAKVLLDLAVALELGGDCLADIAVVRAEPAVFGLVASDPERSPGRSTRWPRTRGLRYSIGFTLPDETADLLKLIPDRAWTPA